MTSEQRVVRASLTVRSEAAAIFELIADPSRHPSWDGNDNLAHADTDQRVRSVGAVFTTVLTKGSVRENHVTEYDEGRRIAWKPAEPHQTPVGHLWRWELDPIDRSSTRVTHTYDWTDLTDELRFERARATTPDRLAASIERLAALAESHAPDGHLPPHPGS